MGFAFWHLYFVLKVLVKFFGLYFLSGIMKRAFVKNAKNLSSFRELKIDITRRRIIKACVLMRLDGDKKITLHNTENKGRIKKKIFI